MQLQNAERVHRISCSSCSQQHNESLQCLTVQFWQGDTSICSLNLQLTIVRCPNHKCDDEWRLCECGYSPKGDPRMVIGSTAMIACALLRLQNRLCWQRCVALQNSLCSCARSHAPLVCGLSQRHSRHRCRFCFDASTVRLGPLSFRSLL